MSIDKEFASHFRNGRGESESKLGSARKREGAHWKFYFWQSHIMEFRGEHVHTSTNNVSYVARLRPTYLKKFTILPHNNRWRTLAFVRRSPWTRCFAFVLRLIRSPRSLLLLFQARATRLSNPLGSTASTRPPILCPHPPFLDHFTFFFSAT